MKHSRQFLKARIIAFSVITFISFVWVVLLCVFLAIRFNQSDSTLRSFVAGFLAMDTITLIMLPILLICEFRPYLDAARMMFLLIFHFGIAASFLFVYKNITCNDSSMDGPGVCQLFNVYIIMSSWVVPALLLVYFASLSYYAYKNKFRLDGESDTRSDVSSLTPSDPERSWKRATLPIMDPEPSPRSSWKPSLPSRASKPSFAHLQRSPTGKPLSPRPQLTIKIPPVGLPDVERPLPTVSRSAVDDRSPFPARPSTSGSRHTSSSSQAQSSILKGSSLYSQQATKATTPVKPPPTPKSNSTTPNTRRRTLMLHDGDRERPRRGSLPGSARRPSELQMPAPLASASARRHVSVPASAREMVPLPSGGNGSPRPPRMSVSPNARGGARLSATWGWSVPFQRSLGVGAGVSPTTTTSASASTSRHSSKDSSQLLAVPEQGRKAKLVKAPNEIL